MLRTRGWRFDSFRAGQAAYKYFTMDPNFRFFYAGVCNDDQPVYGLVDLIDNHFMIQSHDADCLFEVKELIKSKTRLDIVDIGKNRYNADGTRITDNWVIEQWGVDLSKLDIRVDPLTSKRFAKLNKKETYISNIPQAELKPGDTEFDFYKQDLQKQIFFIYFFLSNHKLEDLAKTHFKKIIQCSSCYDEMFVKFLEVDTAPFDAQTDLLLFLRKFGMIYE